MFTIIRNHNYLNGQIFSFLEYLVAAGIILPFTSYFMVHRAWIYALVALGIIINCLVVSSVALVSIVKGEKGLEAFQLYRDRALKERAKAEYPNMLRETLILSVGILLPFLILGTVAYDVFLQLTKHD